MTQECDYMNRQKYVSRTKVKEITQYFIELLQGNNCEISNIPSCRLFIFLRLTWPFNVPFKLKRHQKAMYRFLCHWLNRISSKNSPGTKLTHKHVDIYLIIHAALRPASRETVFLVAWCTSWCLYDVCAGLGARLVAFCSDVRWGKAWNHSSWQPHLALLSLCCCP